jgi:Tfp pilus assembly protein PilX
MKNSHQRNRVQRQGIAMVTVLVLLVMMFSIVTVSGLLALNNRRSSSDNIVTVRAQYAAESGIEDAMYKIFYQAQENWKNSADSTFIVNGKTAEFDTCAFKKWLTGKWQNGDVNRAVNKNNNEACQYYTSAPVTTPAVPNLFNDGSSVSITGTVGTGASSANYTVTVSRVDNLSDGSITISMQSLGQVKSGSTEVAARQLNRSVQIATAPFEGDRFAVLTKAVNCSLCHLHVDNMERVYAPATSTKLFDRVRMAVLEEDVNLNPPHNGDTFIAGTLYVRKTASNENDEVYSSKWVTGSPGKVAAGSANSIRGNPFGQAGGTVEAEAPLLNTPDNKTVKFGKLYQRYPTESEIGPGKTYADWPDGPVPDNFPTIVRDSDGDDFISDAEWATYVTGAPSGRLIVPSGSTGVLFGVRRPSTAPAVVAPITYDPTVHNTTLNNATAPANIAGFSAQINGAITNLTATLRAGNVANSQTAMNTFINTYRSWLIQEALASPNNRDFEPGTDQGILATQVFTAQTNADGSTRNNFWVRYNGQTLQLMFRYNANFTTAHTCPLTPATNVALQGTNCAVFNIPLTDVGIFPNQSNAAATTLAASSVWDGNLIINAGRFNSTNTAVEIDGTVSVNGDVVVRGQIKGKGRLVARGNIYVVGDFVYGCGTGACKINDGSNASYSNPKNLPLVALLAGGVIAAGDYDFPDYRGTNGNGAWGGGVFDLINDQVGRTTEGRINNTPPVGWSYYNIPGSTGSNSRWMGFVPMIAANANQNQTANTSISKRYFKSMPFGLTLARPGFGAYQGTGLNNGNTATVISLYPSNGPIRTGSRTNNGFYVQPGATNSQINNNLTCTSVAGNNHRNVTNRFNQGTQVLNTNFWCTPPALTGTAYHRTWNNTANTTPALDQSSWVAQSPQNTAVDANVGMTTGWLGGVLDWRGTGFTRMGDLSQSRLIKLMWLSTMESGRDVHPDDSAKANGPLRTDGIYYSTHGIFTLARSYQNTWQNARSTNEGRWIHNGSVIAAELGFLVTGDYTGNLNAAFTYNNTATVNFDPSPSSPQNAGPAMGIFFDERAVGFLEVQSGRKVRLRRVGSFTQANR